MMSLRFDPSCLLCIWIWHYDNEHTITYGLLLRSLPVPARSPSVALLRCALDCCELQVDAGRLHYKENVVPVLKTRLAYQVDAFKLDRYPLFRKYSHPTQLAMANHAVVGTNRGTKYL